MQGAIRVEEEDRMEREAEERAMQSAHQSNDRTEQLDHIGGRPRPETTAQGQETAETEQGQERPEAEQGQEKEETEQVNAMAAGDEDELVRRTDEYHRREAVQ